MSKSIAITDETVINKIYLIRGRKIMLDRDLAEMYGVTTGNLNKAVSRNLRRFPNDFMLRLTEEEFKSLVFQNGRASWGGTRIAPYAFTEQGVAMLSSVLNSDTAIEVNIQIIRIFTRMREVLLAHKDVLIKLEHLEKKILTQDQRSGKLEDDIEMIFNTLKQLINPPQDSREQIGFK
jgi:hypothetical protein